MVALTEALFGGRLNAFQKVMLQWSKLHPYNAVHVYKIAGPLRASDLLQAIEITFELHGLGVTQLSADERLYLHETDQRPDLDVIVAGSDPQVNLNDYCSKGVSG
jgi:hypothetical protein